MCWVNTLSADDVARYLMEASIFDVKTSTAYTRIMMRLRVYGSLRADDKFLASVAGCTRHFWLNRAWPALQDLFVVSDGRLSHPEVVSSRAAAAPSDAVETPRQRAARTAATARWGSQPEVISRRDGASTGASVDASADASESHVGNHAISMRNASGSHANRVTNGPADASPDASLGASADALAPPRTDSLSLSDSGSSASTNQPESGRGRESARARRHASGDASNMRSRNASGDAIASAAHASPAPAEVRMPADWAPSDADVREARKWGYDPHDIAAEFRDHYLSRSDTRVDWSPEYRRWVRRQAGYDGKRQRGADGQRSMVMAIPGGQAGNTAAVPVLSEEDVVIDALVRPVQDRYYRESFRSGPLPPAREVYKAACGRGPAAAAAAFAWLGIMTRWYDRGRTGDRPPEFAEYVQDPGAYADRDYVAEEAARAAS
jgi:hypothetical protein